jgi:hypothetical protein
MLNAISRDFKDMADRITQDEFFDAIARGDRAMVEDVMRQRPFAAGWGMEISAGMKLAGGGLRMPLHQAALFGQKEVAKIFIDAGADLEAKDKELNTPLLVAIEAGSKDIALMLLEAGADANCRGGLETTPIMRAARCRGYALIGPLVKAGGNINATDDSDCTALHVASQREDYKMMALLVSNGIDTTIKNAAGFTAGGQDAKKIAYLQGCTDRIAEEKAFIENQVDMMTRGSDGAVAVRKPLKFKDNPASP